MMSSSHAPDRRASVAAIACFAAVAAFLFAPGLFQASVPVFRDLMVLVIPLRLHAIEAIGSGELPLWNPNLFFGAPFLANYQSAVLYPPSILLYAIRFPQSLSSFLAFHFFVAGFGMALYLRSRERMHAPVAVLGGLVYAFGGFFISLVPLTNQLEVAAWAPWVLLAAERLIEQRTPGRFLALTSLLTMQTLGGAPESVLLTLAIVLLISASSWRGTAWLAVTFALALALSAAQLLPTMEYASQTDRAQGLPYASVVTESLSARSFLQLLLPHTFSDGAPSFVPEGGVPFLWSLYLGIVPLTLAIVALVDRPLSRWSFLLAAGIVLALGGSTPVFSFLYSAAPRAVGLFRYPSKFFLIAHFALALLAARGLSRITTHGAARAMWVFGAIALLEIVLAACGFAAPQRFVTTLGYTDQELAASTYELLAGPPRWTSLRGAALAIVALLLLAMFVQRRINTSRLAVALIAVTLADVVPIHRPALVFTDWHRLYDSVDVRNLRLEPADRVFHYCIDPGCLPSGSSGIGAWNGTLRPLDPVEPRALRLWAALVPDVPFVYGIGAVAGVDGWMSRDRAELYRALALLPREGGVRLMAALGVKQLIGQSAFADPGLELVGRDVQEGISFWRYKVAASAPRFYLAARVFVASDMPSALARMAEPDFRIGTDAVVEDRASASAGAESGVIEEAAASRGTVRARVSLSRPGFLVVSDTWYPGWSATVDGTNADIVRTNGIVRGVRVPAGDHEIRMQYDPASFRIGRRVSLGVAMLLSAIASISLARRRARG